MLAAMWMLGIEPRSGPVEELPVFVTTEPSPQPWADFLKEVAAEEDEGFNTEQGFPKQVVGDGTGRPQAGVCEAARSSVRTNSICGPQ